jgi:hypothetical protein
METPWGTKFKCLYGFTSLFKIKSRKQKMQHNLEHTRKGGMYILNLQCYNLGATFT